MFCTLLLTFELNVKCLWPHLATINHLEITKIEWSQVSDPIVITVHSLGQLQPGKWKIPIKPGTEVLKNLRFALQDFTKLPLFKNTHALTRHLVKELIRQCQSSVSDDQATRPKRNKTNYNYTLSMVQGSSLQILIWHFFGDTRSIPAPFIKLLTSLYY